MDFMKYEKRTAALKEKDSFFRSREDKAITGGIIIETGNGRGAIRVDADNIVHTGDYTYRLIFFGKKKGKAIYTVIGEVPVGKDEKGRAYFRFDPSDMDGEKTSLDDYTVGVITACSCINSREPLRPVAEITLAGEKEVRTKALKGYSSYYRKYLMESCSRLEANRSFYECVRPFSKEWDEKDWIKVCNVTRMPVLSPMGAGLCAKYRHFIFSSDEKFYHIGIPGRKTREDQPERGESGFELWLPVRGAEEASDERAAYGYWICRINKKNGEIEEI